MSSSGQGFGEGFFYTPEDQTAQQAILRRQAYAKALMQGQRHEGQYGGLADAGNSIAGALIGRSADKQSQDLATKSQAKYSTDLAALLRGGGPGPSPQISNTAGQMSPQADPRDVDPNVAPVPQGSPTGGPLDPEGNPVAQAAAPPAASQSPMGAALSGQPPQGQPPAPAQPQSIMERIAASGNPALMYQFGPQALQAQMQNEMTRGNKVWENNLPMSRAATEQGAMNLENQKGISTFNNQLPMTAEQQAALRQSQTTAGETRRHNLVEEGIAQNPFGTGPVGQAVAQGKTGDEFLATLPPGVASQIKAVGNYRQPAPAGRASPIGMKFMSLVNQAYPSYDSTQFGAKTKARNDFTTGKNGNTVRSLNVAVQHLDQLGQLSDAMGNGDVQMVNKIGNYFATQTGKPAPSNFNAARQIVGDEIVKAIIGAGGTGQDREEAAHNISAASSPQQLSGVIKTYQGLLSGQLTGLKQQYEKSTGLNDFEDYLAPETKAKLQAHVQGGTNPPPAAAKSRFKIEQVQ